MGCNLFLTCPAHWVTGRWGEDLRGKVLKGHHFSVVLHDGFQVERSLLVAGPVIKERWFNVDRTTAPSQNVTRISDSGILIKQVTAKQPKHITLFHCFTAFIYCESGLQERNLLSWTPPPSAAEMEQSAMKHIPK